MMQKHALFAGILALFLALLLGSALAEDDKPTIAFIKLGPYVGFQGSESLVIDALLSLGMVNEAEHAILRSGRSHNSEQVNIDFFDADFDFTAIGVLTETAIDRGADILVTSSSPVTQIAVEITSDMDDPPAVIFNSVFDPFAAGIAKSSCVKPANVTGIVTPTPYGEVLALLLLQHPDIQTIGTIFSSNEASGAAGVAEIERIASDLGIAVESAAVVTISDVALAAESMMESGVEALLIPSDYTMVSALPVLMTIAMEHSVPVVHSVVHATWHGATIHAGSANFFMSGAYIAALIDGILKGEIDIARTGITVVEQLNVGVNLDMAEAQGIDISQELLDRSVVIVQENSIIQRPLLRILQSMNIPEDRMAQTLAGLSEFLTTGAAPEGLPPRVAKQFVKATGGARQEQTMALLRAVQCTDEMIAEQQAELDAD